MSNNNLFAANEIVSAMFSDQASDSVIASLKNDASATILAETGLDISSIETLVVENSADSVHLALPYYSKIEEIMSEKLADGELDDITGGEILITVIAACGLACTTVGAALGATGFVASLVVGGAVIVGGALAATAAVGGVIGGAVYGTKHHRGK